MFRNLPAALLLVLSLASPLCFAKDTDETPQIAVVPSPSTTQSDSGPAVDQARKLFAEYVRLQNSYDTTIGNLYSDDAYIQHTRKCADGQMRTFKFQGAQYKQIFLIAFPLAAAEKAHNKFSNCSCKNEASNAVRIKCTRYAVSRKYYSPLEVLIKEVTPGKWLIVEELSQSQPFGDAQ